MILNKEMHEDFEKILMKIYYVMWRSMHFVRRKSIENCKWIKKAI